MQEFYEILQSAANGEDYLAKLEEFIQRQESKPKKIDPIVKRQVIALKDRKSAIKTSSQTVK
jgi:hypothetical protein